MSHQVLTTQSAEQADAFAAALAQWGIPSQVSFGVAFWGAFPTEHTVLVSKRDVRSAERIRNNGGYNVIRIGGRA